MDPIIIIGAGLCGLALAQGLHKSSIPFKLYERDQRRGVRAQGYRLRLHGEGLAALRSVLADDLWNSFKETCAETVLGPLPNIDAVTCEITAANFGANNPQGKIAQNDQKPYTVDRSVLRQVLLAGLDDCVEYGKEYSHYEFTDSGIIAYFADGTSQTGALIVGADGARSAVRRQYLQHLKVLDTKSRPIYGKTPLATSFRNRILPKATECLSLIKDPKTGSVTLMEVIRFLPEDQRRDKRDLPNDYVFWVVIPSDRNSSFGEEQQKSVGRQRPAELAKTFTAHWHPSLRPLIEDQDPQQTGMFRLLSSDPESFSQTWEPNARVTVVGDAAHAMMPSTASGAVTAFKDADRLARLIAERGVAAETIGEYEQEMRKYASEAVATSAKIGQIVFGLGSLPDAEEASW
ncbi:MAG: hypothetical protein LQ338_005474 [Usnochroma carphineum]|nr:MAG: hypothetical protein LQ338_005474 [Usnochroma carphineum]